MSQVIGENERMQISAKHFEHQGIFSLKLGKEIDEDILRNLLMQFGVTSPGSISAYSRSKIEFFAFLNMQLIVTEQKQSNGYGDNRVTKIISRDATKLRDAAINLNYINIVTLCNRWMGLDDIAGMKTEEKQGSDVHIWCSQNDLDFLIPILDSNGFETLDDVCYITADDLQKMGIDKLGHQNRVLRAISTLK